MAIWFAFTSGDGKVVGIVAQTSTGLSTRGIALALLNDPCDLSRWRQALQEGPTAEEAADRLVAERGGFRVNQTIPMIEPALFMSGAVVGEA